VAPAPIAFAIHASFGYFDAMAAACVASVVHHSADHAAHAVAAVAIHDIHTSHTNSPAFCAKELGSHAKLDLI